MTTILLPQTRMVTVRQEGERVLLIENGRAILDLPWDAAQELARAISLQANRAEETAKAERVIFDQALLMRAGATIGLTSNPAMLDEAGKEAAWNTTLRRAMPGGVRSREAFGTPRVVRQRKK